MKKAKILSVRIEHCVDDSPADAIEFADAEVGIPWVVVSPDNKPVSFGDARGEYGSKPYIPDSTCGWAE